MCPKLDDGANLILEIRVDPKDPLSERVVFCRLWSLFVDQSRVLAAD